MDANTIVSNLPFFNPEIHTLKLNGRELLYDQKRIILQISISIRGRRDCHIDRVFPAIFDTGFSGTAIFHKRHLGVPDGRWDHFVTLAKSAGVIRVRKRHATAEEDRFLPVPMYNADLSLHRNHPGEWYNWDDPILDPHYLPMDPGIGIWDGPDDWPELPLLGLQGMHDAGLKMTVLFGQSTISIDRVPAKYPWWQRLLRPRS